MSNVKIQVREAEKVFVNNRGEKQQALAKVNLEVYEGEFVCLLGPSGCGKTTLLSMIAGFNGPTAGEVLIDGEKVVKPDPRHITIFQEYGLFPWRTVLDNVAFGLESQGVTRAEREKTAMEYIKLVGLEEFARNHPGELSGGMKQRVALARALAVKPDIIFMDEPFGALDAMTRFKMQEEIVRIWQETNKTIIFVTHDIDEAVYLADRVVVMTPLPGKVKSIIPVSIGRQRDRTSIDFIRIRDRIYTEFALKPERTEDYAI
jgi:NitT/TauT family transport system ATP-binding protein